MAECSFGNDEPKTLLEVAHHLMQCKPQTRNCDGCGVSVSQDQFDVHLMQCTKVYFILAKLNSMPRPMAFLEHTNEVVVTMKNAHKNGSPYYKSVLVRIEHG